MEHPAPLDNVLRHWQWMLVAHVLPILLLLAHFLLEQRLLADPDSLSLTYPLSFLFTPQKLRSQKALWNPLNFHGFPPFLGETTSSAPLTYLLHFFLSPLTAIHATLLINFVLGGFLFSLLLRRLPVSPTAAWIGGFTYITSMWWLLPYFSMGYAVPLFPLLLWCIADAEEHPARSAAMEVGLLTYAWYSVHPILLPFLWITGLIVATFLSWKRWKGGWHVQPLIALAITLAVSTFLALPRLLPTLRFASLSLRGGGLDWEAASVEGINPLSLLHILFPSLTLPLLNFGQGPIFIGIFSAAFALAALSQRSTHVRFFAIGYLVCLLIAIQNSPLFWFLHQLPIFSYLRGGSRWLMLGNIAAAALAAVGFDVIVGEGGVAMRRLIGRIAGWVGGIAFAVGFFTSIALLFLKKELLTIVTHLFDTRLYARTSGLPLSHYHSVIEDYLRQISVNLNPFTLRLGVPILALAILSTLFRPRIWSSLSKGKSCVLLLTAIAVTLPPLSLQHQTIETSGFPWETATSTYVREHGPAFSVFPNFAKFLTLDRREPTFADSLRYQAELLVPNRNLWYGVESIDYFDNFMSRRMARLLAWVGSEQVPLTERTKAISLARQPLTVQEKIALLLARKDILDLLNTRTILSPWPLAHPELKLTQKLAITQYSLPLYLYENTTARPLAYFADALVTVAENEELASGLLRTQQWPSRRTLLECGQHCNPDSPTGKGKVEVLERKPTHLLLRTKSITPQWLVVSMNNLPGWRVIVDGVEVSPVIAQTAFFGIPLPTGSHAIELTFSYRTLLVESARWALAQLDPFKTHDAEAPT